MYNSGQRRIGVLAGQVLSSDAMGGGGGGGSIGGGARAPAAASAAAAAALERLLDGDTPARAELRRRMKEHMRSNQELYTP